MKYFFIGSFIGFLTIVLISYGINRHECSLPTATWIDENGNNFQEPNEFTTPLGYCAYKYSTDIGWPSFATFSQTSRDQGISPFIIEWDNYWFLGLNIVWSGGIGAILYVTKSRIEQKTH